MASNRKKFKSTESSDSSMDLTSLSSMIFPVEYETFAWKIPNVSSMVHEVDYAVQSPPFTLGGATLIFKMYPYGQSALESTGFVDLIVERLHPQIVPDFTRFVLFIQDAFDKDFNVKRLTLPGRSARTVTISKYIQNLKDYPEKWRIALNDTLTLVFAVRKPWRPSSQSGSEQMFALWKTFSDSQPGGSGLNSVTQSIGERAGDKDNPEVGKIFKDYFEYTAFIWKILNTPSAIGQTESSDSDSDSDDNWTTPNFNRTKSAWFSFAGATWILRAHRNLRTKPSNLSLDVELERLRSEIPEHHVMFKIFYYHNEHLPLEEEIKEVQRTLFFDTCHTQGDIMNVLLPASVKDVDGGYLAFTVVMKIMKDIRHKFNSQRMLMDPNAAGGNVYESVMAPFQVRKALQDFRDLYLKQEDCDVIIKVKGQEFPAHRLILKARSPVLASAFRSDMKEKATGILDIEDCDPSSFSDILHFIYCGEIKNLSEKNVISIFTAADKYDIPDLRTLCVEFMKRNLRVGTFCDTVALAMLHSDTDLMNISRDFFKKNLQEIIVTVKWQSFLVENPIQANELLIKALVSNKE